MIATFFGCVNYLSSPADPIELLIGVAFSLATFLLLVVFFGKKCLYVSGDNFYRGIAIFDRLLLKEKIDIHKFSEFGYKKKRRTDLSGILEYSSLGLFSNYHECSVLLIQPNSKKVKVLISMSEFEMYYDVQRFLLRWTDLKERENNE